MQQGQREYGDASFSRPLPDLQREISEELLDVANWAYIMWCRVDAMREATGRCGDAGGGFRVASCGHPIECLSVGGEDTNYCRWCEEVSRVHALAADVARANAEVEQLRKVCALRDEQNKTSEREKEQFMAARDLK